MQISAAGIDYIKKKEGFAKLPYKDDYRGTARIEYSVGYGHQIKPGEEYLMNGITKEQGNALFANDIKYYVEAVNIALQVPVTQQVFDMLVSFAYNVGVGAMKKSKLLNAINTNQPANTIVQIWTRNFISPPILIKRRAEEAANAYNLNALQLVNEATTREEKGLATGIMALLAAYAVYKIFTN